MEVTVEQIGFPRGCCALMDRVFIWRMRLNGQILHLEVAVEWIGFTQRCCG